MAERQWLGSNGCEAMISKQWLSNNGCKAMDAKHIVRLEVTMAGDEFHQLGQSWIASRVQDAMPLVPQDSDFPRA